MNKVSLDLRKGDCLELMKEIPDMSIDMILCDLPYGTTQNKWDSIIDLDLLWKQYKRICKGAIVLTAQTPFDKILGYSNLKMLKYEWIWEKTRATGHLNAKKMPMKAHENVLVFYNKLYKYNPQMTDGHVRKTATKRKDSGTNYGSQSFEALAYDSTQRYPRDVIKMATDKQKLALHPTQKPLALMEYLIKTYTDEGDTVLDNCMGSGTTGVAAKNTLRNFIGIEMDANYYDIAFNRIHNSII